MAAQKGASMLCLEVIGALHLINQEKEWCLISRGTFSRGSLCGTNKFGCQITSGLICCLIFSVEGWEECKVVVCSGFFSGFCLLGFALIFFLPKQWKT